MRPVSESEDHARGMTAVEAEMYPPRYRAGVDIEPTLRRLHRKLHNMLADTQSRAHANVRTSAATEADLMELQKLVQILCTAHGVEPDLPPQG